MYRIAIGFALGLSILVQPEIAHAQTPPSASPQGETLAGDRRVLHALNRLTFGPRPGDIERVRRIGLEAWIDQQLAPDEIVDLEVELQVKRLPLPRLAQWKLVELYRYDNSQPKRDDSLLLYSDDVKNLPALAARLRDGGDAVSAYLKQVFPKETQDRLKAWPKGAALPQGLGGAVLGALNEVLRDESLYYRFAREATPRPAADTTKFAGIALGKETRDLLKQNPQGDALVRLNRQLLESVYPSHIGSIDDRGDEMMKMRERKPDLMRDIKMQEQMRDEMTPGTMTYKVPGTPRGLSQKAVEQLIEMKLMRAIESQRQLREVLVDFWSNHFNVDVQKGAVRVLKIADERDVIEPHVLGRFRDLLGASARSPAMLHYLDNVLSTSEYEMPANQPGLADLPLKPTREAADIPSPDGMTDAQAADGAVLPDDDEAQPEREKRARPMMMMDSAPRRKIGGLNENYARELMELHTLGVDGGYTQKDVQEVARCFTGWTASGTGRFRFNARAHDAGAKVVLGTTIPAGGGIRDGEMVLDILAKHPATARFIARKLCMRLVADTPPPALVEKAAQTFLQTDGDLRAVVRCIALAPEFYDAAVYRSKIKSPFEYAVSAVRAMGGHYEGNEASRSGRGAGKRQALAPFIARMGQPLYAHLTPDGYPEDSGSWMSAGALIARFNYAVALAGNEVAEVRTAPGALLDGGSPDDNNYVLAHLNQHLLGGDMPTGMETALRRQMVPGKEADMAYLSAMVLGSPAFQRR